MDKTVGIVGLGIMGGAIARNLINREWRVIGYDIDPARCAELAQAKVTIAGDVAQLIRDAPIIMNYCAGLVLHQLANPDPGFDPSAELTALVTTIVRPRPAEVSA